MNPRRHKGYIMATTNRKAADSGQDTANPAVFAPVISQAVTAEEGVFGMYARGFKRFGRAPGIQVETGRRGRLRVQASIVMRYGAPPRELGVRIQRAIVEALERVTDRGVERVNVIIADVAGP